MVASIKLVTEMRISTTSIEVTWHKELESFISFVYCSVPATSHVVLFSISAVSVSNLRTGRDAKPMDLETSEIKLVTTTPQIFSGADWSILTPFHIILSIHIIFQNSLVIHHYHKDWKRLSSLLFILIAAADIGNAFSEMGRNILELLCLNNSSIRMQYWFPFISILFGQFCYVVSSYFYLVLTVIKTINIVNPFYRLNKRYICISLCVVSLTYFALYIYDNFFFITGPGPWTLHPEKCTVNAGFFRDLVAISVLGQTLLGSNMSSSERDCYAIALLMIQLCIPGFIVLVCMPLQMFYIKKAFSACENPVLNTANHVNITVFMISLLYFCGVSVFSFCILYIDIHQIIFTDTHVFVNYLWPILGKYTLPLLNAALFPTILILRKPDLRAEFKNYINKMLLLPLSIFLKVRSLVLRRNGFIQI